MRRLGRSGPGLAILIVAAACAGGPTQLLLPRAPGRYAAIGALILDWLVPRLAARGVALGG